MRDERAEAVRAALEPPQAEVERVVAAALAAQPGGARRRIPWLAATAVAVLIAVVVSNVRRELPFTVPLPLAPAVEATFGVSNSGSVMLVRGAAGRTLVANHSSGAQAADQKDSYRLMISKGTVP